MDYIRAQNALEGVALAHGVSVQTVIQDIEEGIAEAVRTDDPVVLARWKMIHCEGKTPTAVELIAFLGEILEIREIRQIKTLPPQQRWQRFKS